MDCSAFGGRSSSDDLELGHITQAWLAASDDPKVLVSGQYWFRQHMEKPHRAVRVAAFQDALLAEHTAVALPHR